MIKYKIDPVNHSIKNQLHEKVNLKTKPVKSLGILEDIAIQAGMIQGTLSPELNNPYIVVFAADHGIVEEGVSAYPQEVTFQMVHNFLNEGAAINVFCNQNGIKLKIVDAGVNHDFEKPGELINSKIRKGTDNFKNGPAMTIEDLYRCFEFGSAIVMDIHQSGCNIIGFGEMGIGNTTSAAALMHVFTGIDLDSCVGMGTGLSAENIKHKTRVIAEGIKNNPGLDHPVKKLAAFGGFEIAQMTGAMLKAAELKMLIMIDGFITTSAFLAAYEMYSNISEYAVFSHQSDEKGHSKLLEYLNARPLLKLNMRLGEGTGCAVAYPLIKSAVAFINDMASFSAAGVSTNENITIND